MTTKQEAERDVKLLVSFVAMVFVGLGNKNSTRLQIPISFAYILPMIQYGSAITWDQRSIPKRKFAVMGGLDSIAGILQVFAATYLGGSLIILLGQAAIPISMLISSLLLKAKYSGYQYVGAVVVTLGLLIVLGSGNSSSSTAPIRTSSCVPMCLSSVYKEKTLGEAELDAVYLNGWIAVFQFLFSIPLTFPAAMVGDHPVTPRELPENMYDGLMCYLGQNTITDGAHKDDCEKATVYVTAYLLFNVAYNLLIILILKFGSANILWLAMTIMVPLGNVAFTFPFMPEHQPLHAKDIAGLLFIMLGLFVYRFLEELMESWNKRKPIYPDEKRALISSDSDNSDDLEREV
ncbi:Chloroquine-resistance transporter-like [Phytophthora cactorum]|nr:Chloroquine-resistance transporter-like [Phytophthora cactorum]